MEECDYYFVRFFSFFTTFANKFQILQSRNLNVTFEDLALDVLARHGYSRNQFYESPVRPKTYLDNFFLKLMEKPTDLNLTDYYGF
jgi:hypothetical protein